MSGETGVSPDALQPLIFETVQQMRVLAAVRCQLKMKMKLQKCCTSEVTLYMCMYFVAFVQNLKLEISLHKESATCIPCNENKGA